MEVSSSPSILILKYFLKRWVNAQPVLLLQWKPERARHFSSIVPRSSAGFAFRVYDASITRRLFFDFGETGRIYANIIDSRFRIFVFRAKIALIEWGREKEGIIEKKFSSVKV